MFKSYFYGKKAVLFDLDGTLVDSHPIWNDACAEVFDNLGLSWTGWNFFRESPLTKVWESYLEATGISPGFPVSTLVDQTMNGYLRRISVIEDGSVLIKDGFTSLAAELKNDKQMKLGLVTNSSQITADKTIDVLGIRRYFDLFLYGDMVKKPKPDPEIYELALKKLGLKGREVLCFEDAPDGMKSALSVGMKVIGIRNPLFLDKEYPSKVDLIVPDFTAFPGNLDKTKNEVILEAINQYA